MESHMEGSKEDNKMKEKSSQTIHRKQMSQAEIDNEIAKIREEHDVLEMLLEEDHRQGWILKRKPMKWPKLQRSLQQEQIKWLMQNLREAETEMEVSIFRPEQGEMLGEEDNERSVEDLVDYWHSSEQFEDMMTREANEAMKPCDLLILIVCVCLQDM